MTVYSERMPQSASAAANTTKATTCWRAFRTERVT